MQLVIPAHYQLLLGRHVWNVNLHHQTPYKVRVCAPGGTGGQGGGRWVWNTVQ